MRSFIGAAGRAAGAEAVGSVSSVGFGVFGVGVVGFWLARVLQRPEMMSAAMHDLLRAVLAGELEPIVGGTYPLEDARRAHEDLRARRTVGKLVLVP